MDVCPIRLRYELGIYLYINIYPTIVNISLGLRTPTISKKSFTTSGISDLVLVFFSIVEPALYFPMPQKIAARVMAKIDNVNHSYKINNDK